jgi:hypothetical protein
MSYQPNEPPSLESVDELRNYLRDELRAIAREMGDMTALELRTTYTPPVRPREGMIVSADGTKWNPGGGQGIYAFVGGVWVKL